MQLNFCTYFDVNYLSRGLALFQSLKKNCVSFRLFVLCLDEPSYFAISKIAQNEPNLVAKSLREVESWDKDLLRSKSNRSRIEYYFTLSPILPLYILNSEGPLESIAYLDADLKFFSDPKCLFEELDTGSIFTIEHRFPIHRKKDEIYGRFNVQCQIFKHDSEGVACLERWREQCLEWCYDRLEGSRFADQKYLDEWPDLYKNLVISKNLGAGLAPWNIDGFEIELTNNQQELRVNNHPLVFFHFHSLKKIFGNLYFTGLSNYKVRIPKSIINWLYKPYVIELENNQESLFKLLDGTKVQVSSVRDSSSKIKKFLKALIRRDIVAIDL